MSLSSTDYGGKRILTIRHAASIGDVTGSRIGSLFNRPLAGVRHPDANEAAEREGGQGWRQDDRSCELGADETDKHLPLDAVTEDSTSSLLPASSFSCTAALRVRRGPVNISQPAGRRARSLTIPAIAAAAASADTTSWL
jgi:hypothetical protein